jgi:hypothetical protein
MLDKHHQRPLSERLAAAQRLNEERRRALRTTYCPGCHQTRTDDTRMKCHCDGEGHLDRDGNWTDGYRLEEK